MSVESTINFYLAEKKPGYALQITGEWGAGKTYAVKKILQNKMYYLSLFDIESSDEVYSSIFYLMQKNKEKTKKIFKSLKKIDVSLMGLKLPVGELFSSLSNAIIRTEIINDKPIVFDDIERSKLGLEIIFGIISNYIETHNCHVIILMNDSDLKLEESYKSLSEKAIGRTFKIYPKHSECYDFFIANLDKKNKTTLTSMKEKVISIFEKLNCNSLRTLKRIIFEIDMICKCIDFNKHENITKEIFEGIYVFTILSIAVKQGKINREDIKNRESSYHYKLTKNINKKNKDDDDIFSLREIYEKYSDDLEMSTTILNDNVFDDIIFNGRYDPHSINKSIIYFDCINKESEEIPWKVIYKFMEYSDEEVKHAVNKTERIISDRIYYPLPHILQFISAIIFISNYIEYNFGKAGMMPYFYDYIDDLYEKELLDIIDFSSILNSFSFNSCDGYGYFSSENESFKIIKKYLIDKVTDLRNKKAIEESQSILLLIKSDTDMLSKKLTDDSSEFFYEPLLDNINCNEFVDTLLNLDFSQFNKVIGIITKRIYIGFSHSKLDAEKTWLNKTLEILKIKIHDFSGIKKFRIQNAIERFEAVFN